MKKVIIPIMLLFLTATACKQTNKYIKDFALDIQNHKDRAMFTKLDDKSNSPIVLFNGKDFTNFYTFDEIHGKNNDVDRCFTVVDGVMHFKGEQFGYICTERPFKNFYLRVQVRWGEGTYGRRKYDPRDSGILYHIPAAANDTIWPAGYECQIQESDFGDFWLIMPADAKTANRKENFGRYTRIEKTADHEKPHGEWNVVEVLCYDEKAEHYINGHKVNEAYDFNFTEGKILLQLEGAEVFFKDIVLVQLK